MVDSVKDLLLRDSLRRRMLGLHGGVAAIVAGLFLFWGVAMYFRPEDGVRLVAALAIGAAMVAAGPRFTLPLYFATWFGSGFVVGGLPVSLNVLIGVLFAVSWVMSWLGRAPRIEAGAALLGLSAYTLYALVAAALLRPAGTPVGYQQAAYLVTGLAIASLWRDRDAFLRGISVFVLLSCVINSVGLVEFALNRDLFVHFSDNALHGDHVRINGIGKNAIQFAFGALWMMPWALLLHVEGRTPGARLRGLAAFFYLLVLAILTLNRQTPIIAAGMIVVGLLLLRYRHRARLAAAMFLGALAAAPLILPKIIRRVLELGAQGPIDPSYAIRADKLRACMRIFTEHPFFGGGLNNFQHIWWDYRVPGHMYVLHFQKELPQYIDLGYVQLAAETGLVGIALFLLVTVSALVLWLRRWRAATRLPDTFCLNALAMLAMGFSQLYVSLLVQDTFFYPHTYALFGILFAVSAMTAAETRRQEPRSKEASP